MCSWWTLRSSKPLFWIKLEGGFDSHTLPLNIVNGCMFNYLMKTLWFLEFLLIIFLDRDNPMMVYPTVILLLLLTVLTVLRSLISRNEWREIIEDGDVEIKDKIEF